MTGNRREILNDFYERSVADLPDGMRRFVEDKLLTKSGFRDNPHLEQVRAHAERLGRPAGSRLTVLTHCNAGALATAGYGTALGVIRAAVSAGKAIHVYVDETRPFLQGARLTAWELGKLSIPYTIITDSAAASLMAQNRVNAVIVGADRIALRAARARPVGEAEGLERQRVLAAELGTVSETFSRTLAKFREQGLLGAHLPPETLEDPVNQTAAGHAVEADVGGIEFPGLQAMVGEGTAIATRVGSGTWVEPHLRSVNARGFERTAQSSL